MTIRIRDKITMMRDVVNIYGESGPDLKKISNANVIMKANAIRGSGMGWEKDNAEVKNS